MIVREADTIHDRRVKRAVKPPPFFSSPCSAEKSRRGERRAGSCCGGRWVAGDPCAPVLGGEDGALARRPQAPLEVVEKFLTSIAVPLAKSS
jgi:hypothetical protein